MAERILIQNARIALFNDPALWTPKQFKGTGLFAYRATLLIAPENPAMAQINAAIDKVAKEKWAAKSDAILKQIKASDNKCFFTDGDLKTYNGYPGNWAIVATRQQNAGAPVVCGRGGKKDPIGESDGRLYSGCYVNSTIEVWAQDNEWGKAIRALLINVQLVRQGESFGGAAPATAANLDDLSFEEDEDLNDDI